LSTVRCLKFLSLLLAISAPVFAAPDGLALLKAGKANDALQALNARIQTNPNDAAAYNLIARVNYQLERWDEAISAAEKAVALDPQKSEYHQWLGRVYGEKADTVGKLHPISAMSLVRKVKAEFEKAVMLDAAGSNPSARADLAEFYLEAPSIMGGDKTKARLLADFVMTRDPALGHYLYGMAYDKQNAKDKAEQEYKAAIEASRNQARYWVSLASFYRKAGRLDDMEAAVSRALSARHEGGIALFDGASLLLEAGRNFAGAIQMLRQYLSLNDSAEDGPAFQAHYKLGALLEKQGDRQAALSEYHSASAMAPQYRPAQDALVRLSR